MGNDGENISRRQAEEEMCENPYMRTTAQNHLHSAWVAQNKHWKDVPIPDCGCWSCRASEQRQR